MRIPRNLRSNDLIQSLERYGYSVTRQTGSHIRLTTSQNGEHHITIPAHKQLRLGTLSMILSDIADHFGVTKDEVLEHLFKK